MISLAETLGGSEELYRRIIETTHQEVCIAAADHRYLFVNDRLSEMLGYRPGELLGMNVFDLLDKADAPAQRARMDRRQQGRPESGEMGLRRKDGTEVWVLFESHSIFENGRYQGVLIDDDGHIGAQGHRGAARAQRGAASPGTEVAHIGSW